MPATLKSHLLSSFREGLDRYARDLAALTPEQLDRSPGGAARSAYDFTYEVVFVHRRIESRLRGQDPGLSPFGEGWITAPAEFRNPESAISEIKSSGNGVAAAFEALEEEDLEREITTPIGKTSPLSLMDLADAHINYHDAQLNYIQALHGDEKVHWQD